MALSCSGLLVGRGLRRRALEESSWDCARFAHELGLVSMLLAHERGPLRLASAALNADASHGFAFIVVFLFLFLIVFCIEIP